MAKHYTATRVKETRYVLNGSTGEVDAKLYTTTYDGKAYGSNNRRGGFVYSIFILVCCFLVFLGVYGVSRKDNPMDLIIQSGQILSDYGEVSGQEVKGIVKALETIKLDVDNVNDYVDVDDMQPTISNLFRKFVVKSGILTFFVNVYNKLISFVSFLIIVPYTIGVFGLNLVITFCRIVYLFVV